MASRPCRGVESLQGMIISSPVTESWIVWVGRDCTSCLCTGSASSGCSELSPVRSWKLPKMETAQLLWMLLLYCRNVLRGNVSLYIQSEPPASIYDHCVSFFCHLESFIPGKSLASCRYWKVFFKAEQASLGWARSFSSSPHSTGAPAILVCSWSAPGDPSLSSLQFIGVWLVLGAQNWTQGSTFSNKGWVKGNNHSPVFWLGSCWCSPVCH